MADAKSRKQTERELHDNLCQIWANLILTCLPQDVILNVGFLYHDSENRSVSRWMLLLYRLFILILRILYNEILQTAEIFILLRAGNIWKTLRKSICPP